MVWCRAHLLPIVPNSVRVKTSFLWLDWICVQGDQRPGHSVWNRALVNGMRERAVVAAFDGSTMQQVDSEGQFEASLGTRPANSRSIAMRVLGMGCAAQEHSTKPTRRKVMAPHRPGGTFDRLGTPALPSTVGRLSKGDSAPG